MTAPTAACGYLGCTNEVAKVEPWTMCEECYQGAPVMTPSSVPPVSPNKPKTPLHSFRVADELWNAAKEKARAEGTTIADVLRDALEKYLKKKPRS